MHLKQASFLFFFSVSLHHVILVTHTQNCLFIRWTGKRLHTVQPEGQEDRWLENASQSMSNQRLNVITLCDRRAVFVPFHSFFLSCPNCPKKPLETADDRSVTSLALKLVLIHFAVFVCVCSLAVWTNSTPSSTTKPARTSTRWRTWAAWTGWVHVQDTYMQSREMWGGKQKSWKLGGEGNLMDDRWGQIREAASKDWDR